MSDMVAGKVAVVTGAGGGIGKGIALALAASGGRVVVNDISAEAAQAVVDQIVAAGGKAVANTDSVATRASAENIVRNAVDLYGKIDIVVNNAGNLRDRLFHKMSEEEWSQVIDVHLNGSFFVSRAAASHFREQESGAFIHMTSTSGLIGNFGQSNYSAAKMGIVGLSKSIALDMARFNVRSNCIAPFAWTAMTSSIPAETPEEKARVQKLQKMEAGKIAPLVVYLASDAAEEVTAQIFGVRANEIMLFSQPRPIRSVHMSSGWTPEDIAEVAIPAMKNSFFKLERSPEVIGWDPI
ncbi:SDR family NAD(P)-dependent oxidoreductase [Pusillimonas sp. ANT_WB101]|uniref:SDR family NAD(P)-dependent oxidoreductase n=1 Tax=Pusillimonas sp. ANT_WB101 TaxID=2597356 RepID=UPI0011EEDBE5|nr:SDR family NAD(P)-dependent oxidoreductase [Pusillimonas sp. ANT_WB101]KAA0910618.1 SDR family NAD(P)-dependent oxidoreductase [Pusillimonas sp. ANT_WB101]NYT78218.1 SDR family NAD(P)-dependent oxidoreductase [Alcaligenaceae bacterium]